jgi:hypothetical protein
MEVANDMRTLQGCQDAELGLKLVSFFSRHFAVQDFLAAEDLLQLVGKKMRIAGRHTYPSDLRRTFRITPKAPRPGFNQSGYLSKCCWGRTDGLKNLIFVIVGLNQRHCEDGALLKLLLLVARRYEVECIRLFIDVEMVNVDFRQEFLEEKAVDQCKKSLSSLSNQSHAQGVLMAARLRATLLPRVT